MTRYILDPGCRGSTGPGAAGGSPLRLFRLSPNGVAVARSAGHWAKTRPSPRESASAARLLDRLLEAGAIHPRPTEGPFRAATSPW